MTISPEQLERWMTSREDERLEFKEAKKQFDSKKLVHYCAALANEGGGHLVMGVTDKVPRKVVGSQAFLNLEQKKHGLLQKLYLRVDAEEIDHPDGRVVVFSVPSRPIGVPIKADDIYWMRSGESIVSMTAEQLKSIFDETGPDFSAEICTAANFDDLSIEAIAEFRRLCVEKETNSGKSEFAARLLKRSDTQLLEDAELLIDGQVTFAALVLFSTHKALGRHLAQAEVIFEWRLHEGATKYDRRTEYREGFFLFQNRLWQEIDARNQVHQYQDGLFRKEIPTFREDVIREAILNALTHRDYRKAGSVFIRHWPTRIEIVSPGGFPEGVTLENLLWKQNPRNRRLAEAFARCGLVERSGQGADLMYEWNIRDAKLLPDFSRSDPHEVWLNLDGQVQDEKFIKFLEQLGTEMQVSFTAEDLLVFSAVHGEQKVPPQLAERLKSLQNVGAIERYGKKLVLARRFYQMVGRKGEYTRKRGLNRETNKALLMKHIEDCAAEGSQMAELMQVLPDLSRGQIKVLLSELSHEQKAHYRGATKASRWFPGNKSK